MSTTGILLLLTVIYIIPMLIIFYWVYTQNKKADERYERKMREIDKYWINGLDK